MTDPALLLRGPVLVDGRRVDVVVRDGKVDAVGPPASLTATGTDAATTQPAGETIDLSSYLLLPAPVEAHTHLDKAYSADIAANPVGDLDGAVAAWLRHRPTMTEVDIADRACAAVEAYVAHGATAARTHVDIGEDIGLNALAAVAAVREVVAPLCDVQIVAFASNPLSGRAGARSRVLLGEAMSAGADVAGACPALDPDPSACIEACLRVAADRGAAVDLHIDEGLDPDLCTLSLLAETVRRTGFPYSVTASHCVSLGMMPVERARQVADQVAAAGIAVVCLPQTNLYLQGRNHPEAAPRGLTALRVLRAAGVRVAAGGDNLQDPFNCLGRADPLETAALLVLVGHDRPETAYSSISSVARDVLGLPGVEIRPGAPAELLAIRAGTVRQAIAESTVDRVVIHAGRIVARTTTTRSLLARQGPLPGRRA